MEHLPLLKKVERTIAPMAETMGYDIVRILMIGSGNDQTLQIMAERPDGTMHIEDCSRLSQAVSALLDVEDLIPDAYVLEVSSPGIDRPLTRLKDFDRYKDHEARIELSTPLNGQKRFRGMLRGLEGEDVLLDTDTGAAVHLPFRDIEKAKLVLTDELIRAAMKAEKEAKKEKKAAKGKKKRSTENTEAEVDELLAEADEKPKATPKNNKKTGSQ